MTAAAFRRASSVSTCVGAPFFNRIEINLSREDAERDLADAQRDEPGWRGLPEVVEIEIAEFMPN